MFLAGFVELVWDPLSTQQSQTLTTLCKRIQDDYSVFDGEQSKPVKVLSYDALTLCMDQNEYNYGCHASKYNEPVISSCRPLLKQLFKG